MQKDEEKIGGNHMSTPSIDSYIADIKNLFPNQLTLSSAQLAQIRNKSVQTLARERKQGIGIRYKESQGKNIEYPIREIAIWLHDTIVTV